MGDLNDVKADRLAHYAVGRMAEVNLAKRYEPILLWHLLEHAEAEALQSIDRGCAAITRFVDRLKASEAP